MKEKLKNKLEEAMNLVVDSNKLLAEVIHENNGNGTGGYNVFDVDFIVRLYKISLKNISVIKSLSEIKKYG